MTFPHITNFDLLYGYNGVDANHPGGDPDNGITEDNPLAIADTYGQLRTVLATFESTDDLSGFWADMTFERADGGLSTLGSVAIHEVEGMPNTYQASILFTQMESINFIAPDGLFDAVLQLHSGFEVQQYGFHMFKGTPPDNWGVVGDEPVIVDSVMDEDGVAGNGHTLVMLDSSDFVFDFTVTNEIIDESPYEAVIDESWQNEPTLTVTHANGQSETYAMGQGQFVVEVINGQVEFFFTEEGINQFDLYNVASDLEFDVNYRVVDVDGNVSDAHHLSLNIDAVGNSGTTGTMLNGSSSGSTGGFFGGGSSYGSGSNTGFNFSMSQNTIGTQSAEVLSPFASNAQSGSSYGSFGMGGGMNSLYLSKMMLFDGDL